jgi:hypothetical protein
MPKIVRAEFMMLLHGLAGVNIITFVLRLDSVRMNYLTSTCKNDILRLQALTIDLFIYLMICLKNFQFDEQ